MVARWIVPVLAILVLACASTAQAESSKIKPYVKVAEKHKTTLAFFEARRWMLAPRYRKCWMAPGWHRRKVCRVARREVAETKARLANVRRMIERLRTPPVVVGNRSNWLCIYSHEKGRDGWRTRTGNGYYGGLQMDLQFQRTHGLDLLEAKGTADNWTPDEQMMVAERAYHDIRTVYEHGRIVLRDMPGGRGFYPWPNTARACGLI